ncbi:hypothetical protein ACOSQ4_028450 [Xanthoceras sorbifolium]
MRVEMPLLEKGKKSVAMCLFGKLIANKEINREAFRSAMPRIWRTTKDLEMEAMGMNMFVFRFKCEWDRKRILEGGPWCFDKHLLVLREAHGIGKVSDIDFQFSPMWIHLHNIPLVCMSKDMGRSLGEMVGTVVDVDPGSSGDCLGKFFRVKVRVDVEKPLKRLLRVMVGDPEELCVVLIKYERMPNFCHFCGRIGHLVRECHLNVSNIVDDSKLRYGSWKRAAGPSVFRPKGGRSYRPAFDDSQQEKDSVGPNNSFRREEGIEVPVDLVSGFKCASQGSEGYVPCNNSGTVGTKGTTQPNFNQGSGATEAERVTEVTISDGVPFAQESHKSESALNKREFAFSGNCVAVDGEEIVANREDVLSVVGSEEDVLSYIAAPSVVDENLVCDSAAISVTDSAGGFVEDGEISSPKVKRWKRLARGKMKGSCIRWRSLFPSASVRHLEKLGSDHSPLLISEIYKPSNLCSELGGWNSRFHFEEAWTMEDECAALINSSWKSVSGGNAVRCVKKKMQILRGLDRSCSRLKIKAVRGCLGADILR